MTHKPNDNKNDAYIEMHVTDAIEHARTDRIESALEWLTDYGFIRRTETHLVQFMNCNFKICGMTFAVMLEYNISNRIWTCEGITSDIELWYSVNGLIQKLLNSNIGIVAIPRQHTGMFEPEMSRIGVMANIFMNWLKSCKVGNYIYPKEALESYCRCIVSAMDSFTTECKKHTLEWWSCGYLTGIKLDELR